MLTSSNVEPLWVGGRGVDEDWKWINGNTENSETFASEFQESQIKSILDI